MALDSFSNNSDNPKDTTYYHLDHTDIHHIKHKDSYSRMESFQIKLLNPYIISALLDISGIFFLTSLVSQCWELSSIESLVSFQIHKVY